MTGPRLSIIPARAATDRALKPRDLQVLCVLGRHTDDLGWCRRSQVKMADEMGCARSTVYEAIERLVKNGYLEKHAVDEISGRDSAHLYRVVLDPVHPNVAAVKEAEKEAENPCRQVDTPAGISAPPAGPEPAPPAGPGPAPINDPYLTTPLNERERERASADAGEEEDHTGDPPEPSEERPETAAFQKRVMWFCNGKGFQAGAWPDWDTSSPGHIARCFAKLSIEERAEAERWRDAYLLDLKRRKKRPVPVANFIRDRLWTGLDPALLQQAEPVRVAALPAGQQPRPDGWASFLGPVGMAWLFARLMRGPDDAEAAARPFLTEPMLRQAWPGVWWWQAIVRQKNGAVLEPQWHGLKAAMEPVPQDSERMAEWRSAFERMRWPWPAIFDRTDVVYFPRGGPDGLEAFALAVAQAGQNGDKADEHGGRSQAAE